MNKENFGRVNFHKDFWELSHGVVKENQVNIRPNIEMSLNNLSKDLNETGRETEGQNEKCFIGKNRKVLLFYGVLFIVFMGLIQVGLQNIFPSHLITGTTTTIIAHIHHHYYGNGSGSGKGKKWREIQTPQLILE